MLARLTKVNRAIELLAEGQPVYYTGAHAGHVLTYAQGKEDATTWADAQWASHAGGQGLCGIMPLSDQ